MSTWPKKKNGTGTYSWTQHGRNSKGRSGNEIVCVCVCGAAWSDVLSYCHAASGIARAVQEGVLILLREYILHHIKRVYNIYQLCHILRIKHSLFGFLNETYVRWNQFMRVRSFFWYCTGNILSVPLDLCISISVILTSLLGSPFQEALMNWCVCLFAFQEQ